MGFVEEQHEVSRRVYGIDPPALTGRDRAQYVWSMVGAAHEECTEVRRCFDAKPWGPSTGKTLTARQDVAEELADLLIFLCNLALVEGISTEDLLTTFRYKLRKNANRHQPQPHRIGAV